MPVLVSQDAIDQIESLIESGDVVPDDYKQKFVDLTGEPCHLEAKALVAAIALTDDDDDALFVGNVRAINKSGYQIVADTSRPSAA